uniref:hypothetical protein n=1 Tax=Marinobacterium profundum TaxID=1714300 RepID=UPI0008372491|nr:hypothetical protein [Marinobacterium profundum]
MNIKQFTSKLLSMTLAIGLGLSLSFAQAATPIQFNPDGQGNDAVEVGSFDWAPGSILVVGAIPLQPVTKATGLGHTMLAGVADLNGDPRGLSGLNIGYEITVNVGYGLKITSQDAANVLLSLDVDVDAEDSYFEIYYDDFTNGVRANPLSGMGFQDGELILSGQLTQLSGNFTVSSCTNPDGSGLENLDQFLTNDWAGVKTVCGEGSQSLAVLVQSVNKAFFISGVDKGTIIPFNNSQVIAYQETNPSRMFETPNGPVQSSPGLVNGVSGLDLLLQSDPNNAFQYLPPEMACRVTGGGNNTSGIPESGAAGHDGTFAEGLITPTVTKGNSKKSSIVALDPYRYTMGGQAGANTALQPQPKGEWTHTNHDSPDKLKFTFHAGTSSAPAGTEIDEIICTDEGWCRQARPAPNKQIDFVGIGTFKNIDWQGNLTVSSVGVVSPEFANIQTGPSGNKPNQPGATYHWFQVHIEDLGEPGNKEKDGAVCPPKGSGNDPFANPPVVSNVADCDCADFYHIRIYQGVVPAFNADGEVTNIDKDNMIYEVYGYLNGGNFQIHPLTGFDLK